nr:uncharacterized protein LOC127315913 [Lolium perenne]
MRMLSYGIAADLADEYIRSAESTNLESCKKFVIKVCEVFGDKYLRSPNAEDTARLLAIGEERGFPGSNNDLNVLQRSPVFAKLAGGEAPEVNYSINGHQYTMGYYLADGPAKGWKRKEIGDVMTACVIMHNMIVEEE